MKTNDGGPAFPVECHWNADGTVSGGLQTGNAQGWATGMSLRDYFAAHVQADDRLVKCVRAMDDKALAIFAICPTAEREEHITETGPLDLVPDWLALDEVGRVAARLELEAKAIARVRYMQADAMLRARAPKDQP